jgi:hypothetical protein
MACCIFLSGEGFAGAGGGESSSSSSPKMLSKRSATMLSMESFELFFATTFFLRTGHSGGMRLNFPDPPGSDPYAV